MRIWMVVAGLCLAVGCTSKKEEAPEPKPGQRTLAPGPWVDALEGEIQVRGAKGSNRSIRNGATLQEGDTFTTGSQQSLRMVFSKGSAVLVAPHSRVRVGQGSEDGFVSQVRDNVHLKQGRLRALVKSKAGGKLRFKVTTPSAVMGVRGTDFVVDSQKSQTQVRTLKGEVDVASNHGALSRGEGTRLKQGQMAKGVTGKKPLVSKFDPKKLIQSLRQQNPRWSQLGVETLKEQGSGSLLKRLREGRPQKAIPKPKEVKKDVGAAKTKVKKKASQAVKKKSSQVRRRAKAVRKKAPSKSKVKKTVSQQKTRIKKKVPKPKKPKLPKSPF